jgi:hypothetical protein
MQNVPYRPLWLASLLALLLMLAVSSGEASVRATLDRDTVYAGDTVTLTIESDGQQSGLQPDLAPLENDFDVLGTSTSTQVSILNGRRSDKTRWQVQLQPRHTGPLRIPSLGIGGQQTAPLDLKITEAPQHATMQADRHIFVEAEVNSAGKQTYVQQQIPYTVRLYYDGRLQEGELSAPKPQNAVVEQLGEDTSFSTVHNGLQYNVIERHYVISPEKSGSLYIPPATFRGRIAVPQPRKRNSQPGSLMEEFLGNSPFANNPFFNNSPLNSGFFGGHSGKPVAARSRPVTIDIKPRPATASHNWLPAEAVTLSDSWTENPPQFKAGEPVSRTVAIQTKGLSGSQIPQPDIAAPANARLYPDTPQQESRTDGKTIYGVRTQTLTYIPDAQGTLDVPALTLNWWDTRHDKAASTTLPAWQFKVLPGAAGKTSAAQTRPRSPAAPQSSPASQASEAMQAEMEDGLPGTLPGVIKANWLRLVIGGGLLLALLGVMMARHTKQRRQITAPNSAKQVPQATHHTGPKHKSALRDLEKACKANDQHAAARALLSLGHAHWPDEPPYSLDALAARIDTGQKQLRELERSLYAVDASPWNGTALWDKFRHGLQKKKMAKHDQDDGLNPLYPQYS